MAIKTNSYYSEYTFQLQDFDGPLDLLLSLIKDKKIDIFDINLVELADQYLKIINQLKESEIDIAGDYLVMAATLLKIKASLVLQEPNEEEPAEVVEEKKKLIQQLVEYQQFKEIKEALKTFESDREDIFIKAPSNVDDFIVDTNDTRLDGHSNPVKLIAVLRKMFERVYAQQLRSTKLETFNLSPSDQFPFIKKLLKEHEVLTFEMVFTQPSIKHFVVTLLAVLVLAKQQILIIEQDEEFGDIRIKRGELYDEK
ncbi:segregation/condensation protein A [Mycoplasmopsis verecunda]|uniref:Segregation and condensation protein A n=1 Tax=Mycoplasmopsis verecunda TaxID=171291 RepID=A0A1T4KQM9_9BACT|nr:segregation/condensation protein A [Mycoplasmopsis verecunda]WPB54698.1 segregation/condensation protein A [Mycoplasmopsis verecunda]SJZ44711.1 condensin subunit ScpA [Mycoplasmopsis verecunda]